MTIDIRADWEADYSPSGERGSAARRLDAGRLAGATPRNKLGQFARTQKLGGRGLTALAGLQRSMKPAISRAQIAKEVASIQALIGPASLWPVDTGYSIAGFFFIGEGKQAVLANRADYVPYVEERTNAIARTLAAAEARINKAVNQAIEDELNG